ncbi:MAG: hypothetical protein ACSLE3_06195 [Microbacteriaceae bacterium]
MQRRGNVLDVGCGDGLLAQRFDLITFVASLHHLDTRAGLTRTRTLLNPGGTIAVVGLSANKAPRDWAWSAACLPAVRIGSWRHSEVRDVGVAVGAVIRRARYYRYLLRWTQG